MISDYIIPDFKKMLKKQQNIEIKTLSPRASMRKIFIDRCSVIANVNIKL
jgi:hypothetical protein